MPTGIQRGAPFARVCEICGQIFEASQRRVRICSRIDCRRESIRRRSSLRYASKRDVILADRKANRAQLSAYDRRWRASKGFHCIECGSIVSPNATRCQSCAAKDLARRNEVGAIPGIVLKCPGCGALIMRRPNRTKGQYSSCKECRGMQARAARLMGVSKVRVHAVIQEALQTFGAEQTLRQALGHALNKRGLSIESVLNLQG